MIVAMMSGIEVDGDSSSAHCSKRVTQFYLHVIRFCNERQEPFWLKAISVWTRLCCGIANELWDLFVFVCPKLLALSSSHPCVIRS